MAQHKKRVYLDYNATAPLLPIVKQLMMERLGLPLNPSSVHTEGREGRRIVETARARIAAFVNARPAAVRFTSGGTEANNTALSPMLYDGTVKRCFSNLLVSAVEHPCVLAGGRFSDEQTQIIACDENGVLCLDTLRDMLEGSDSPFVSVMLANNETGVIQPISDIADLVHSHAGFLHVDAVQAAGKISVDLMALKADSLSLSAHKIGGPQGVGALVSVDENIRFPPLITGGGQEFGHRAGTENVSAIEGFGIAAEEASKGLFELDGLQCRLESKLCEMNPASEIFAKTVRRLPNTTCLSLPGKRAETALIAYDLAGIAVSSGSACSSGKVGVSPVLSAMGVPSERARGAIRVSTGWASTPQDVDAFVAATEKILNG